MSSKKLALAGEAIDNLIREIRGQRVMLDSDLAAIYGIETKTLNRAVKRMRLGFQTILFFESLRVNGET